MTPIPDAPHSMLAPLGPQAQHVLELWNVFVVTTLKRTGPNTTGLSS